MRVLGLVIAMGLLVSRPAAADTKVLRFARSTQLPTAWQQLPDRLAKAIATEVGGKASEESLVTLHCDETPACLEDVAKQVDATELIFGTIRSGLDRNSKLVTITRFAPGIGRAQETFTIQLVDEDSPRALVREASSFLKTALRPDSNASRETPPPPRLTREPRETREIDPPRRESRDEPREDDPPRHDPRDDEDEVVPGGTRRKGMSSTTYVLLGTGGASLAIGLGLTVKAWSMRDEIARAPVETRPDLLRLAQLEQRGRTYTTAGAVLSIGGAAVIAAGIVYAWRERRGYSHGSLTVLPSRDGATFAFVRSW